MDIEQSNEPRMGACRDGGAVVRVERRRRWSDDEKLAILKETTRPGAIMAVVARKHGIGTGQLYTWRRQLLQSAMAGFVPVELTSSAPPAKSAESGRIEIKGQGGFTVSVDRLVDRAALKLVLEVVGGMDR
ncbi:transposase [Novosphingobium sp. G106]|uniref:IS66-like element accessory protein TnpA n=1 Tax=Novosphingobium sp. G106 TaxID=2849500 RepID=UPI001C2D7E11|nr:transposase [Novosphingobium sp. G106]MBV1692610.1 transposase [Novosphingobium sp. G106]